MATATQYTKTELQEMTVAELKEVATEEGIDVPSHATKDEIVKAIMKDQNSEGTTTNAGTEKAAAGDGPVVTPLALTGPVITLPLAAKVSDSYGEGAMYQITTAMLQSLGANLQANFLLDNIPAGAIMQFVRIKHTQSVVGPGPITAANVQVTDNVNAAYGSAFDVFQAVSPTALSTVQLTSGNVLNFAAVTPVYLVCIVVGGNWSVVTAGAINVWIRYLLLA